MVQAGRAQREMQRKQAKHTKKVCVTCAATPRWAQRADDALCCLLAALIGRWRHELHSVTANAFAIDFKFVGLTSCGNRTPL